MPSFFALLATIYSIRNGRRLENVHKIVNSRMSALVKSTKTIARAAGIKEGESRARARSSHKRRRKR